MKKNTLYSITASGFEEVKPLGNLEIGTRVYAYGGGMIKTIWTVYNNNNNIVKVSPNHSDNYFSHPLRKMSNSDRPHSKKFGIGFYYDESDFRFSSDEIVDAICRANLFIEQEQKRKEAEAEASKREKENLPLQFPHLIPNLQGDQKITKKNLVAELKKRFPNVKFRVIKDGYSTYNIYLPDGIEADQVRPIANSFTSYTSSYCGDYRDYEPSNFNRVFGGFKYIFLRVNNTLY